MREAQTKARNTVEGRQVDDRQVEGRGAKAREVNGVDVGRLIETVGAIKEDPSLGAFRFRAHNKWLDGTKNRSLIQDFYGAGKEDDTRTAPYVLENDEPDVLTGKDEAPNPVEFVLHGLAGCVTTTLVAHAASRGIEIESVSSELEGDIDVRGFLGISEDVPKGYSEIRVNMKVKSDAPREKLEELARYSPVLNTLIRPVNVVLKVEKA
jgi:uncharacterized OsmC-like protein